MNDSSLCVLIACHKPYGFPDIEGYMPLEVGAVLHSAAVPGAFPDNAGDNISEKNPAYCELTGLYWAWKNLNCDYIGLVHYRRYFAVGLLHRRIAEKPDCFAALQKAPVILPKKRHYVIETNYSQYIHAHHQQDLSVTHKVLEDQCPEYLAAFDRQMRMRS